MSAVDSHGIGTTGGIVAARQAVPRCSANLTARADRVNVGFAAATLGKTALEHT